MAKLQVITQQVAISSLPEQKGSKQPELSAYLAVPKAPGRFPGIIVLQEIFGVNLHIRAVTERIASLGYVAIAPALFCRQAPGFDVGYTSAELELGRTHAQNTRAPELLADIQAAIDYLKTLPQVQANFGCVGFCFGGHVAYLAATLPDIAVTASFYGAGITTTHARWWRAVCEAYSINWRDDLSILWDGGSQYSPRTDCRNRQNTHQRANFPSDLAIS